MEKPQVEGQLDLLGDLNYTNEAVFMDGSTGGFAFTHHEGNLAYNIEEIINEIGGHITGDAALYL